MASSDQFEPRVARAVHAYLDAESGPDPRWHDAPVSRRVNANHGRRSLLMAGLRVPTARSDRRLIPWAVAALVIVGVALATLLLSIVPRPGEIGAPSPTATNPGPSTSPVASNAHSAPIPYPAPSGVRPPAVAADDGSVWLRDASGNALRLDVASQAITKVVPMGSGTGAITFGAGSIWATGAEGGHIILRRINPSTGAFEGTIAYHLGDMAEDGLAANGSEVWIFQHGGDIIETFRSSDMVATSEFGTSAFDATKIEYLLGTGTTSADGAFWADMPSTGFLVRIPISAPRLAQTIVGCGGAQSAADPTSLWSVCGRELVRFDLINATQTATLPLPQGLDAPVRALALGGGWLWLAAGNAIDQIDPADGRVVARTVLDTPGWPLFASGKLVVIGENGTLSVLTPTNP